MHIFKVTGYEAILEKMKRAKQKNLIHETVIN